MTKQALAKAIEEGDTESQIKFNEQLVDIKTAIALENQRKAFNAQNKVQIEQSYLTYLRNASMADTAAQNEANRINVQNSFAMSAAEQAFMYQQLRDEATYLRESYENSQTREAQLYIAAIGNESAASKESNSSTGALTSLVAGLFS